MENPFKFKDSHGNVNHIFISLLNKCKKIDMMIKRIRWILWCHVMKDFIKILKILNNLEE